MPMHTEKKTTIDKYGKQSNNAKKIASFFHFKKEDASIIVFIEKKIQSPYSITDNAMNRYGAPILLACPFILLSFALIFCFRIIRFAMQQFRCLKQRMT